MTAYTHEIMMGKTHVATIECDIQATVYSPDNFELEDVTIDGKSLFRSGDIVLITLARSIIAAAEEDEDFIAALLHENGFYWSSRGGTDPAAHWLRAG